MQKIRYVDSLSRDEGFPNSLIIYVTTSYATGRSNPLVLQSPIIAIPALQCCGNKPDPVGHQNIDAGIELELRRWG